MQLNLNQNNNAEYFKNECQGFLADEQASLEFAQTMAGIVEEIVQSPLPQQGLIVYLLGDLGAGKSFISRGFIQYFLPHQKVKSPTYTLVESYGLGLANLAMQIHHFDLYRLCDPEELEYLGVRDLLNPNSVSLVEWPAKGNGVLPVADVEIRLHPAGEGRDILIKAHSEPGQVLVNRLVNLK